MNKRFRAISDRKAGIALNDLLAQQRPLSRFPERCRVDDPQARVPPRCHLGRVKSDSPLSPSEFRRPKCRRAEPWERGQFARPTARPAENPRAASCRSETARPRSNHAMKPTLIADVRSS